MTQPPPRPGCRLCGATSYRPVISRDGSGAMRASGLLRCSGCSLVFTHPSQWRGVAGVGHPAPPVVDERPEPPEPAMGSFDTAALGPFGVTPRQGVTLPAARAVAD